MWDALGMPAPGTCVSPFGAWSRPPFRIDGYTRRAFDHGRRIHGEICAALKCTEVHHGEEIMPSGHVIGTYRMGVDPTQSVVNPDQRAHDHPNLFLLGSGVFPTSAASNPTLTIAALALRAVGPIQRAMTD
jgi:choline dehydrogenase-like flavoprotein